MEDKLLRQMMLKGIDNWQEGIDQNGSSGGKNGENTAVVKVKDENHAVIHCEGLAGKLDGTGRPPNRKARRAHLQRSRTSRKSRNTRCSSRQLRQTLVRTVASIEPMSPKIAPSAGLSQTGISTVVSLKPIVPEDVVAVITFNWERDDIHVAAVEEFGDSQDVQRLTALEAIRRIAPARGSMRPMESVVGVRKPVHTTLMGLMKREDSCIPRHVRSQGREARLLRTEGSTLHYVDTTLSVG